MLNKIIMAGASAGEVTAFTSGWSRFSAFDIKDPTNLIAKDSIYLSGVSYSYGFRLDTQNKLAYVAVNPGAIVVVDISDRNAMETRASFYGTLGSSYGGKDLELDKENNVVFLVSLKVDPGGSPEASSYNLTAIDISDLDDITQISTLNLGAVSQIAYDKDNAIIYVSLGNDDEVKSVDVSNPASMTLLDTFTSANLTEPRKMQIDTVNQVLYVGCEDTLYSGVPALVAIDISDPENMVQLDSFTNAHLTDLVYIAFDPIAEVVYCSSEYPTARFTAIDVSDPSDLTEISSMAVPGWGMLFPQAVACYDDVAFMCLSGDDFYSVDISNPSSMSTLHEYSDAVENYGNKHIELLY